MFQLLLLLACSIKTEVPFDEPADTDTALCGADLDADGDVDLAFAEHDGRQLRTLQNNGAGTFAAWVNESIGSYITGVACADVDGDGAVDVLMTEEYAGAVWYYGNVR